MTTKRRNLYLYLTLACFLGIIAIFVVDGYFGIYDTVYVTGGEYEQKIEPDFWLRENRFGSTNVNWGEKAFFRYEIDNRRFSSYVADFEVTVWHGQEKVTDLLSSQLRISGFDKEELTWVLNTSTILPGDVSPEQSYKYTVIIRRGEIERRIIVNVNPVAYPMKVPIPAIPRPT